MHWRTLWRRLLSVEDKTVVCDLWIETDVAGEEVVVAAVRPRRREQQRCPECRRRSAWEDTGDGRKRWRTLDVGTMKAYVEADAPRVRCLRHGIRVAAVPWARHDSRFTRAFEDQAAWLATHSSRSAVSELVRTAWRTVGSIVKRVSAEALTKIDPLDGLRRIGVDEVAYRKGHYYLTVVVDHDSGRLVWAAAGRNEATLNKFFDLLGEARSAQIELVSADAASWIANVVAARCPNARRTMDQFHVIQWATDALDEVRRQVWNDARRSGLKALAKQLKGARFALWKNAGDLTDRQHAKLASIAKLNNTLYRAYLLKEQLRQVFVLRGQAGIALLDRWLAWAQRCRIDAFVELGRRIRRHRVAIDEALTTGLSNGLVESMNGKLRLIHRRAFGFRTPEAMIALAMLALGGLCPPLPGRA